MRYLSVCSGIEAASVAWEPLGWEPIAFAEIDPFASAVLAHHYPAVPNLGDFTQISKEAVGDVDVLVGGTPCQDFSVAGLRTGIAGDRGQLTVAFLRLLERTKPRWMVWENVPGVLSSDGGRAFGAFLGALEELGYGWAYRILDAQYFGVPQRRRRVFVVACFGDGERAGEVLFERNCLRGDSPPRRQARETAPGGAASSIGDDDDLAIAKPLSAAGAAGATGGTRYDLDNDTYQGRNQLEATYIANAVTASAGHHGHSSPRGDGSDNLIVAFSSKDNGADAAEDVAPTLRSMNETAGNQNGGGQIAVAFNPQAAGKQTTLGVGEVASALSTSTIGGVATRSSVRRLTPRECERLQGFPDDWTLIPDPRRRGKPAADQPRYHALGNSMAVPCMRWIGEHIAAVESIYG